MEYKLVDVLTTRMVEAWEEAVYGKGIDKKQIVSQSAGVVRAAAAAGWFVGDKPNPDDMSPVEVIQLSTKVWQAYSVALGGGTKNSSARRQTTQKE